MKLDLPEEMRRAGFESGLKSWMHRRIAESSGVPMAIVSDVLRALEDDPDLAIVFFTNSTELAYKRDKRCRFCGSIRMNLPPSRVCFGCEPEQEIPHVPDDRDESVSVRAIPSGFETARRRH